MFLCYQNLISETSIASSFAILISIGSLILAWRSLRHSKKTLYVNTVTSHRLKWIEDARSNFAEMILLSSKIQSSNDGSGTEYRELMRQFRGVQALIRLRIPKDEIKFYLAFTKLESSLNAKDYHQLPEILLELSESGREILERQWELIKGEVLTGEAKKG